MASNTLSNTSVRACESVAQKLFVQCRDSGSSFKSLTGSLRTLRNVLGDVDEALDDHVGQQDDPDLPCSISKCEAVLSKLEAAFVLSRCSSWREGSLNTVACFATELDTANRDFIAAYKKMTRSGMSSRTLHPNTLSTFHTESRSNISITCRITDQDAPSDTCSCGSAPTSVDGTKRQSRGATEKEVFYPEKQVYHHYHPDRAHRLWPSSSQTSLQSKGPSSHGSSSNARPDPYLASPFEAACGLIHNDDALLHQTAKYEPSWVPSAELEGDGNSLVPRDQQSPALDYCPDMFANHSRKDSLLGDGKSNAGQQMNSTGEDVEISRPKSSDNHAQLPPLPAEGLLKEKSVRTSVATATEAEPSSFNDGSRDAISSQDAGDALPVKFYPAQAARLPRPPPPTPANTGVDLRDFAQPMALPDLPQDFAQSTALPESDSEDNTYGSTPVMKPVAGGKDIEIAVSSPVMVTEIISKIEDVNAPTTESGAESVTIDAHSTTEGKASQEENITRNEREDDAPEMVQVKKRQVPMKSNSVADIKHATIPLSDDKEPWQSFHGASRLHTANRRPSAPPAVTFQPAATRLPISRNEHCNATCDVCDQNIYGTRHKCLDCTNWDNCDECVDKARPSHADYRFTALGQPVAHWPEEVLDATTDEYLKSLPDNSPSETLVKENHSMQSSSDGTTTPTSRRTAPERQPPVTYAESPDFVGDVHHRTSYGPCGIDEATPTELLDEERVKLIVHFFNSCDWERAEMTLIGHLHSLAARSVENTAIRRVQHLLAVCASFRGQWDEATTRFIQVLKTPIKHTADIDDGDCAAAHWLGDLYAMQNRRAEALLAYSIAERSSLCNRSYASFRLAIQAEQSTVQIGVSKADFKQHWSLEGESEDPTSILSKYIISMAVAKQILASPSTTFDDPSTPHEEPVRRRSSSSSASSPLGQHRPRASYMSTLDNSASQPNIWNSDLMKLTHSSFLPSSSWPMPFDPLISLADISRGRLYAYECDMLSVFAANPDAKLPRPSLLNLTKISSCFAHPSLPWLITTLRTLLSATSIHHSEIVNIQGTFLCCRYSPTQTQFAATINYFTIALFRHPLPGKGYGVEIVSEEGIGSARIARVDEESSRGVNGSEGKRLRSLLRAGMEEASMREKCREREGGEADVEKVEGRKGCWR